MPNAMPQPHVPSPLFWLHVPKCGTAFVTTLCHWVCPDAIVPLARFHCSPHATQPGAHSSDCGWRGNKTIKGGDQLDGESPPELAPEKRLAYRHVERYGSRDDHHHRVRITACPLDRRRAPKASSSTSSPPPPPPRLLLPPPAAAGDRNQTRKQGPSHGPSPLPTCSFFGSASWHVPYTPAFAGIAVALLRSPFERLLSGEAS